MSRRDAEGRRSGRWSRRPELLLVAAAVPLLGLVSVWLGQDASFDLLTYHYYDGYAFLHDRLDRDVAPGGLGTYHFPLLHVLPYLGLAHLPAPLYGFLLGAVHGLAVPLVYWLAWLVLPGEDRREERLTALAAALLAATGSVALALLGTSFGDNLVALPALAALGLVIVAASGRVPDARAPATCAAAGLLAGAAAGLKLTMAVYAVALVLAALVAFRERRRRVRRAALIVAAGAAGFVLTAGHWCYRLWTRFGNPVFPYANGFFRSPLYRAESFRDQRFTLTSAWDLLQTPLDAALGRPERLQEVGLRDGRLALVVGVLVLGVAAEILRRARGGARPPASPGERALVTWWVAGYVLWAVLFHYYRYLAPLELAAPLVAFVVLRRLLPARTRAGAVVAISLALVATTRADSWGRARWQSRPFALPVPAFALQERELVLLLGHPIAVAVPSFRDDARFLHLYTPDNFGRPEEWTRRIAAAIDAQDGPLLLLATTQHSRADAIASVQRYGLEVERCEPLRARRLGFRLCTLRRSRGPGAS